QADNELKVSVITLRRYIKDGKIRAVKVGRSYVLEDGEVKRFLGHSDRSAEAQTLIRYALDDTRDLQYLVSRKEVMHKARSILQELGDKAGAQEANIDANIFGFWQTSAFT